MADTSSLAFPMHPGAVVGHSGPTAMGPRLEILGMTGGVAVCGSLAVASVAAAAIHALGGEADAWIERARQESDFKRAGD